MVQGDPPGHAGPADGAVIKRVPDASPLCDREPVIMQPILSRICSAVGLGPRRRFAARVQAALWLGSGAHYSYHPKDFALRRDGTDQVVFLGNIFATCQQLPRGVRRQQIAGFVHSVAEAIEPYRQHSGRHARS